MLSKFSTLRIGIRLALGFGMLMVLLIALIVISMNRVSIISENLKNIGDVNSVKQRYAINFRGSVHDRAIALRDIILEPTTAQVHVQIEQIAKLAENYKNSAGPLDGMMVGADQEEKSALQNIKEIETRALALTTQVINKRLEEKHAEASTMLLERVRPAYVQWLAYINKLIDIEEAKNKIDSECAQISSGLHLFNDHIGDFGDPAGWLRCLDHYSRHCRSDPHGLPYGENHVYRRP